MPVSGFPVVVSTRGIPVVVVEDKAPLATIATNGRGLPITPVEKGGLPLVVQGLP